MRYTAKKLKLPHLMTTMPNPSLRWPNTACPLTTDELNGDPTKRCQFTNKHSGQKFEVALYKDYGLLQAWYFEMKPIG